MPEPSPHWTSEDILTVIGWLVTGATEINHVTFRNRPLNFGLSERMKLVALMPAEYLELNRKQILQMVSMNWIIICAP